MVKKSVLEWLYKNISWKKLDGVISLNDAAERCDTSCRDNVTLRNDCKICCSVARRVAQNRTDLYFLGTMAATKMLQGMSVAGFVALNNFSCNLFCTKNCAV